MVKSDSIKVFLKMLLMIVGASLVGLFLMWIVYLLPVEPMVKKMINSYETIRSQDSWDDEHLYNYKWAELLDTGTNIIMFHEVIYPNTGNPFEDSLLAPGGNTWTSMTGDWTAGLMDFAENRVYTDENTVTYARYWHGYLVLLKPLFMIMNLNGIYIINTIFLAILCLGVVYLMYKRLGEYTLAYIVALFTMHPENIVVSFQLSSIFYALNITLLLLLWKKELKKEQMIYIFVFDGILVAFFDFLTYPYVAVAIPLLICYLLNRKSDLIDNFSSMIVNGISFFIGYAGMWTMKWIFATMFTSENVILDAIKSVLHRTGVSEETTDVMTSGVGDSLYRNAFAFFDDGNLIVLGICVFVALSLLVINRKKLQFNKHIIIPCGFMMITPFAWLVLLSNHCSLHPHLEWRTLCVVVFVIAIMVISLIKRDERTYG